MIGQAIGHYRIVKKLASGGMGDVFVDDRYVYFIWVEDDGDILVTDISNPAVR